MPIFKPSFILLLQHLEYKVWADKSFGAFLHFLVTWVGQYFVVIERWAPHDWWCLDNWLWGRWALLTVKSDIGFRISIRIASENCKWILTQILLVCCRSVEKMQTMRLDGNQIPITQILPNRFWCNLQYCVRQSFLHHNITAKFLVERQNLAKKCLK